MRYTLMHKRIPVAGVELDDATGGLSKLYETYRPEHFPVGVAAPGQPVNARALNTWWTRRAIPMSRSGIRDALPLLGVELPVLLLEKSLGLSLSDQYWVRPESSNVQWEDVNFFGNSFSEDVGNALFGRAPDGDIDLMSPDNSSEGWLKKKWVIADGKRVLVKAGSAPAYQEPLNEVLATAVLKRLDCIPYAAYTLHWEGDKPMSACEDFITPDTELITALQIVDTRKKPGHLSMYQHFLECCEALGIPNVMADLDKMLTLDYLIVNTDRHLTNFGAVRNAETLEWQGLSPVFDCGTSMWHDQFTHMIRPRGDCPSKPFRTKHSEQIKLVENLEWLDFKALSGIDDEFSEILKQSPYIDDDRRNLLCRALQMRTEMLVDIQPELRHKHDIDMNMDMST